jgi:hypothetical protein
VRSADALTRQPSYLLGDVRRQRGDRVVILRLDSHNAGGLGGAKTDREQRSECDRNLTEDVAGTSLANDAVDSVDYLHRLDSTLEQREQRSLFALARGVFARPETYVGRDARKPLAPTPFEVGENSNATNVVCGHHESNLIDRTTTRVLSNAKRERGFRSARLFGSGRQAAEDGRKAGLDRERRIS